MTLRSRLDTLHAALRIDAEETDGEGEFPTRSFELLRSTGFLSAPVPECAGGESLGEPGRSGELLELLARIGHASLVVGRVYEGHINALALVSRYGSDDQRERWYADARDGCLFGVWNTEAEGGVVMTSSGSGWQLAGAKTFASGCGHVDRALVTAAREGGWQMAIVDTNRQVLREDRQFWKPLGMRASASFRADFTGTTLRGDDLLGVPGDYYAEPMFSGGAVRFAAVQQGGVEAVFDETRRYLAALGRTGDPHQRMRLGAMAMAVESGRLWLRGAADGQGASADTPERVVNYAALVRTAIETNALLVMRLAERSVGARGLIRPEIFERLHRDLTHYLRQPAPDAVLENAGAHVLARSSEPASQLWN